MLKLRLLWAAHNESVWLRRQQRVRLRRHMENINVMPEALFKQHFRFTKALFKTLCRDLRSSTNLRGSLEISVEIKVLCALNFFATGSYQRIVGAIQHIPQRTASRCIKQVVAALTHENFINKWICFPQTLQQRSQLKQEFQRKYNLPGVIGCIDCTHIAIVKPKANEQLYFNRKSYHSLNVQMICNNNLELINVNAKFGGATHDAYIWSASGVEPHMQALHQSGEHVWLLGDSGYPLRPWLMTPVLDAVPGSQEAVYTSRHVQARNCIERCIGLLKSRWKCLLKDRVLRYHPDVASKIVLACCVLHNIAVKGQLQNTNEITVLHDDDNEDSSQPYTSNAGNQAELIRGRAMLSNLISRL